MKFPHTHTVKLLHFPLSVLRVYLHIISVYVHELLKPLRQVRHIRRDAPGQNVWNLKKKTYLPLAASAKDDLHSWPARHYITGKKSSLHFTVPPELKLHDE